MSSDKVACVYTHDYPTIESQIDMLALENVFSDLQITKPVSFVFMSDDELLDVNIQALNHDYYTDVITFDYSDDEDMDESEVLISVDRIEDNAKQFGVSFVSELHRICIHGMLHLAGHDDDTPEKRNKMSKLEDHYLALHCST